ncbi:PilW family protein [Massilia sp. HP4]|uniref:PilW family protein n=1 Tax=Massilia sp. HP4 TaxID=2562316 RepID=UPI0010BFB778|nr:PilW family protein [Massilia sp. HP4]
MRIVPTRRAAGFSLVELMVSIVIGLLAVLFATRIMTDSETSKRGALGGSDSMQNGMMAMFSISGDAEQAGYGLNDPILNGCDTIFKDSKGYELAIAKRDDADVTPLTGAVIVPGADGKPDQLTMYAGSAPGGTGTTRLLTNYIGGNQLVVDRDLYGFAVGDVIVVAPENGEGQCALAQVAALTVQGASPALGIGDIRHRYNTGAMGRNFDGSASRIFNLGRESGLSFHTWLVESGVLRLRATNLGANGGAAHAVADNIVSLKAQYGFDMRGAADFDPERGMQVGGWSSAMVDADGDGIEGGAGDYQRIAALRIAVVARAKTPERPGTDGVCTAQPAVIKVFGSEQPQGVDPVEVELDVRVKDDPVDWRCYRYRTFETIVPMRNTGWRPTA